MTRSKFGNNNAKVVASSIYGLEEFVSNLASPPVDTSDLEAKTQNISSDESKTTVTGEFRADTALVGGIESKTAKVKFSMATH